ncbi:MAG: dihydrofolate reductase family protein [Thermocrispum sp.]
MRNLVVGTFVSVDGVMQAPGAPDEDPEGGFDLGGWQVPLFDDEAGAAVDGWMQAMDALLLGRKTYEIFAGFWPHQDDPIGERLTAVPKYVASRTLTSAEWANTTVLTGEAADAVRELKQQDGGEIHVTGSGDLVQTLIRHGLVDEFRLIVHPVLLGKGKRLFGDGTVPTGLELAQSTTTSTGSLIQVYRRAGDPTFGSFT